MALNIKSPETERIVRELAKRTGLSITEAVHQAAAAKLDALKADRKAWLATLTPAQREKLHKLRAISRRGGQLPALDTRSDDEILGYNDQGTFE